MHTLSWCSVHVHIVTKPSRDPQPVPSREQIALCQEQPTTASITDPLQAILTEEFASHVRVKLIKGASQGVTKARSFMHQLCQTCVCLKHACGFQNFLICTYKRTIIYQSLI
jgi:hypothetical protein